MLVAALGSGFTTARSLRTRALLDLCSGGVCWAWGGVGRCCGSALEQPKQTTPSSSFSPPPLLIAASSRNSPLTPTPMHNPQGTFAVRMLTRLARTASSRAAATALPATTWTQRGKKKCWSCMCCACWCTRQFSPAHRTARLACGGVCGRAMCRVRVYACVKKRVGWGK